MFSLPNVSCRLESGCGTPLIFAVKQLRKITEAVFQNIFTEGQLNEKDLSVIERANKPKKDKKNEGQS